MPTMTPDELENYRLKMVAEWQRGYLAGLDHAAKMVEKAIHTVAGHAAPSYEHPTDDATTPADGFPGGA